MISNIAAHQEIGLILNTYRDDNIYQTHVVCIGFNEGQKTVLSRYPSSYTAIVGHLYWTDRFKARNFPSLDEIMDEHDPSIVKTGNELEISIKSLMMILGTLTEKDSPILVTKMPGSSEDLKISITSGVYIGNCRYDLYNGVAYQISSLWLQIINQVKDQIADTQFSKLVT